MRRFLIPWFVFFPFLVSNAVAQYQNTEANIDEFCRSEWTKRGALDARMYEHCRRRQREGLQDISHLKQQYVTFDWLVEAEQAIVTKWTKRGIVDYAMVHFSLNREVEAYLDLAYGLNHGQFRRSDFESCYARWARQKDKQWGMTLYCLNRD